MKVKELTEREAVVCGPEDSLERAARIMWEEDCGCVPIVDGARRPVGMITDRDVCMAAYLRGRALREVAIHEVMARDVRCCSEQDSLDVAHRVMREHQIRRLPIVDDQGVLVGVVALSDLARCTEREGQDATQRKVADALLESFLAVSRPRSLEADVVLVPQDAGARGGRPAGGARSAGAKTTKSAKSGKGSKKQ